MKQTIKTLLLASLFSVSSIFAMNSVKPNGCKGPVLCDTTPFDAQEDCCYRWHIDIGLIYQQPASQATTAGFSYTPAFTNLTAGGEYADQTITNLQQCFPYAIGATASLGHFSKHDHWYFGGRIDWLRSYVTSHYDNTDNPTLLFRPTLEMDGNVFINTAFNFDTSAFTKVNYTAGFELINFDVILSRGSFRSRCFSFTPIAGVKAMWFRTEIGSTHITPILSSGNTAFFGKVDHTFGAGPMFGFNAEYFFLRHLALFSDNDVAVLYGNSHAMLTTILSGITGSDIEEAQGSVQRADTDCGFILPFRSIIGIKFADYFFEERHHLSLKLGYDVKVAINYPHQYPGFSMGGLYTKLEWNF